VLVTHEPTSAALVRAELTRELAGHTVTPRSVSEVVLVASELVGNAVRHAAPGDDGRLRVHWTVGAHDVTVSVTDGSRVPPRRRTAEPTDTYGRGLAIVEALAADWGVEAVTGGKRVWARVPIER
jgi:two-component sensor histidine kinase